MISRNLKKWPFSPCSYWALGLFCINYICNLIWHYIHLFLSRYNGIKDMAALQLSRLPSLKALFLQGKVLFLLHLNLNFALFMLTVWKGTYMFCSRFIFYLEGNPQWFAETRLLLCWIHVHHSFIPWISYSSYLNSLVLYFTPTKTKI